MKGRTALLILLFIVTIFPLWSLLSIPLNLVILVLANPDDFWIYWRDDRLSVHSKSRVIGVEFLYSYFVVLSLACAIFLIALFLLVRDFLGQRRKKEKMREF